MKEQQPADKRESDDAKLDKRSLHPSWRAFMEFCAELRHGDIERLTIQDGLPVLAERTKQKIKFTA
ncbi:MAG: hypothetical protein H7039_21410 [Bryobacteraceae bacterium]|nr:hypothetical protein [Bryobacteraceae bacterium]